MGVQLGNGFPDTHCRPVNTDLDLAGFPFALCPPLLGIGLIAGPGLAPSLLAYCPLGFLFFVRLPPMVYFMGCHFRPGGPWVFFFGEPEFGVPVGQMLMSDRKWPVRLM